MAPAQKPATNTEALRIIGGLLQPAVLDRDLTTPPAKLSEMAGETYVVFGKIDGFEATLDLGALDGRNGFTLNGIDARDNSGYSVSSADDVNGDGIDDILVGAYAADAGGVFNAGETYVVFGRAEGFDATFDVASLDGTNGFVLAGTDVWDVSGYSVSSAGDVNGDGIDDILIGANINGSDGSSVSGETYLVFGRSDGFEETINLSDIDGVNGYRLDGISSPDYSGFSVSEAGDVNGDGIDDILIGAYRNAFGTNHDVFEAIAIHIATESHTLGVVRKKSA